MSILEMIQDQLSGAALGELGKAAGLGEREVKSVLPQAIALLTGGLARNASRADGAESLNRALETDHGGGILEGGVASMIGQALGANGDGILKHILGDRRLPAETVIGQSGGVDASAVSKLLPLLAPILMGALGKAKREQNLGAGDLAHILGQERQSADEALPRELNGLSRLLDTDGDGDPLDDVARMGMSFLNQALGRRKPGS